MRYASFCVVGLMVSLAACKVYDPLYCDADEKCTDPDRPFCDLGGDYPASEGVARTCIPDPNAGGADGGADDDGAGDEGSGDDGSVGQSGSGGGGQGRIRVNTADGAYDGEDAVVRGVLTTGTVGRR